MTNEEKLDQIIQDFHDLRECIKDLCNPKDAYSSIQLNELAAALSKAQGEYKPIGYNRENPYFKAKYADLDAIINAVRPALTKNNLSFVQQIRVSPEGSTLLHSILMHASGQWIESRVRIVPVKNDAQTFGSTLTYQKRYAAASLLGVTTSHDLSDDDAEVSMQTLREQPRYNNQPQARDVISRGEPEVVTKEQLEQLEDELKDHLDLAQEIMDKMNIRSLADLPKNRFLVCIKRIREIKETMSLQGLPRSA